MKIKCIKNCTGIGYENFKKGDARNLKKELANKLIAFGYATEANGSSGKQKNDADETSEMDESSEEDGATE